MSDEGPVVEDPRLVLKRYGLWAKKSWGQNYLIDTRVHEAIVRATVHADDDVVLEIGGGLGTLTARLAHAVPRGRVIVVEREPDMVRVLQTEVGGMAHVSVRAGDALKIDYAALAREVGRPLAMAGNLPYQIASPLLFHMLDARAHLTRMVVMLQKEMVDRILAPPGTKAYGALGVMITMVADAKAVIRAKAGAFHPAPKVDSTVLALTPLAGTRAPVTSEKRFSEVVHAAFGQRRKTLRNALRARWTEEIVDAALGAAGIDGQRRGETLTVAEFAALSNAIA